MPQIIGGASAPAGTFGMMAFVYYDEGSSGFECSGTVLSPNVVLTAGHCGEDTSTGIVNSAAGYTVITGAVDWADAAGRQVSGVSQVLVDPSFQPTTLVDDATLLQLSSPTTAPSVALASSPGDVALLQAGAAETIAGWGRTFNGETAPTYGLQYATTAVQSPTTCAAQTARLGWSFDPTDQLCVIDPPAFATATCQGDSGGPLLADEGGANVEVGIISAGAANCDTSLPDLLTRADAVSSWADAEVAALAPATPAPTPTPIPSPSPTPTPSPTSPALEAGVYRGRTSQRLPLRLTISPKGTQVTSVQFGFRLRCTRRRAPRYRYTGLVSWPINARHSFSRTFRDSTHERYRIRGSVTTDGSARGTLTSTWRSRRYGRCWTGRLRWHTRRA